jgi:cyclopropane-fatty-acyl-phospholipid synthase
MTYSSALYAGDPARTLADAQRAKLARALERLELAPGARLLEIGCGWGSFAELAARDGHHVTGLTLSAEQLAYARKRLGDAAAIELRDYRDERGRYDAVVSIEMIEAVGERWWPAYFARIAEVLPAGGRALVQAIVIRDELFARYRTGTDFIQKYVFPGGMLPSPARFELEAAAAGLRVAEAHRFGADYARTLAEWRRRFLARWEDARALGFDERFRRLWEFYLAYCEAGFATGSTDVVQYLLVKR